MSNISKVTREKNENYTTIGNEVLRDKRISLKAKGLLITALGLPPTWELSVSGLQKCLKEEEKAIRSAFNELIEFGYCDRKRLRDPETQLFIGTEYIFRETPINREPDPPAQNPHVEKPHVEKDGQLNPYELNTDSSNSVPNGTGVPPLASIFGPPLGQPSLPASSIGEAEFPRVSQTPQEFVWGEGVQFLTRNGATNFRGVLGEFLRDHHHEDVVTMLKGLPEHRLDYVPYMKKLMKGYLKKDAKLKTNEELRVEREQFAQSTIAPPSTAKPAREMPADAFRAQEAGECYTEISDKGKGY